MDESAGRARLVVLVCAAGLVVGVLLPVGGDALESGYAAGVDLAKSSRPRTACVDAWEHSGHAENEVWLDSCRLGHDLETRELGAP